MSLLFGKYFIVFTVIHSSHLILTQNFCGREFCYLPFKNTTNEWSCDRNPGCLIPETYSSHRSIFIHVIGRVTIPHRVLNPSFLLDSGRPAVAETGKATHVYPATYSFSTPSGGSFFDFCSCFCVFLFLWLFLHTVHFLTCTWHIAGAFDFIVTIISCILICFALLLVSPGGSQS